MTNTPIQQQIVLYFSLKLPRVQNIRSVSVRHERLNSNVERLHGTIRDDSAEVFSKGYDNALLLVTKTIDNIMTGEIQIKDLV
ncbi:MAG: hypothetical protein WBE34_16465, partial [Candidatus Nitrosopolaris sp.]